MSEQQEHTEEEGTPVREPVDEAADDLGSKPSTGDRTMYTVDDEELA